MKFQPYSLQSQRGADGYDASHEFYAVRFGGSGGRIIASDLHLNHCQAERLARELQSAFELGRQWGTEA